MIELVLVYCLAGPPARCIEDRPFREESLTAMSCVMLAQQAAAQRGADHPGYRFAGWRCGEPPRAKQAAELSRLPSYGELRQ